MVAQAQEEARANAELNATETNVQRLVKGASYEKRIEQRTVRSREA